jgi:hypothetical protein
LIIAFNQGSVLTFYYWRTALKSSFLYEELVRAAKGKKLKGGLK